jgi:hypothetical protein
MPIVKTKTTYLEMFAPPSSVEKPPQDDVDVIHLERPSVELYRWLYRSVGAPFQWVDRLVMPEEELRSIIHHDRTNIYLLRLAGETTGYAELDRRTDGQIELAYFGLFTQFLGQGLGKFFLNWVMHKAWSFHPERMWLHTCDLDHPAALPNYVKAGFEVYDEKIVDQQIPEDMATRGLTPDVDSTGCEVPGPKISRRPSNSTGRSSS